MADKLPVVWNGSLFEQLQSGDDLVDQAGNNYVTEDELAAGIADAVTSDSTFSAAGLLVETADTDRGVQETAVETADVVTAGSAFGAAGNLLLAGGNDKTTTDSSITETNVSDVIALALLNDAAIDDIEADYVSAASSFATDDVLLASDGTGRGAKATTIDKDNVVQAASNIDDHAIVRGDGGAKGVQSSAATVSDGGVITTGLSSASGAAQPVAGLTLNDSVGTEAVTIRTSLGGFNLFIGKGHSTSMTGTTGSGSIFIGRNAAPLVTSGLNNFVMGADAADLLTSGSSNFILGNNAGKRLVTNTQAVFIGNNAGRDVTGANATYIGASAGFNGSAVLGTNCVCIGVNAAWRVTTGTQNVFLGADVATNASQSTSASDCNVVGRAAYTTGSSANVLGTGSIGGANAIAIGNAVTAGSAEIRIGNSNQTDTWITGILEQTTDPSSGDQLYQLTDGIVRVSGAASPVGRIAHGTYTPTATGVANVDSATPASAQYMRVGNVVTVSGTVSVDPTAAAGTTTSLRLTLPVASNFANANECAGSGSEPGSGSAPSAVIVAADPTNDEALLTYAASATSAQTIVYHYTYRII